MAFELGPRRAVYVDIQDEVKGGGPLSADDLQAFEAFDGVYRSLCALMYNYVPMSGHPGGSISSGRFVAALLFETLRYDLADPDRADADVISYAAGHKALGLYGMWALRNEVARIAAPELLPADPGKQLRLEDLLGFRRNPVTKTPLFVELGSKPLDGHPTPATPFVKLATGASGVGVAASVGLAFGAADYYGEKAPRVHIVEGEGGMTPGRVAEAMAAAGTASLGNVVMHVDFNQASIDSNRVCRDGEAPGDYVQWNPVELAMLHDWNVVYVADGTDFQQVVAAQRRALAMDNGQPTAVVYRTTKGWKYGIEGRASHGAGHKMCSPDFYEALHVLNREDLPTCDANETRCQGGADAAVVEGCYWQSLTAVRKALEGDAETVKRLAERLARARASLDAEGRAPREGAPDVAKIYALAEGSKGEIPEALRLVPGTSTTLRGELGKVLGHYNAHGGGALFAAAADLLGSTSVSAIGKDFPQGFWNAAANPGSRLLSLGGIAEDAMAGIMSGIATYGRHLAAGSSYAAFLAPLGHIAARLHAIGNQARKETSGEAYKPFFLVMAHAGLKTGEDGPTHADPQALQLVQENFPKGTALTLTPWDPQEMWPLVSAALARRPAVVFPVVTRPSEPVLDRAALGLAPATDAAQGVYALRAARGAGDGTVILQGSGVTYAFVREVLPRLDEKGVDLNVYYVASAELFDLLPADAQARILPEARMAEALGITGFTLPTMMRWVTSRAGREAILHPFMKGHYLGSGQADRVLEEAGLDGESQLRAVLGYLDRRAAA